MHFEWELRHKGFIEDFLVTYSSAPLNHVPVDIVSNRLWSLPGGYWLGQVMPGKDLPTGGHSVRNTIISSFVQLREEVLRV